MIAIIQGRCDEHLSGPALKQADSHSSIHEAALGEAEHLTALLHSLLDRGEHDQAYEIACILLEHWESRTLAHAQAEEEGLYLDMVELRPEWTETVAGLTRDHELMRILATEIRRMLAGQKISRAIANRFEAMILIDVIHNRDEIQCVSELGMTHHDS